MASGTDDIDTTMTRLQHSIANKGANQSGAASRCNSTIPRKGGLEPPNDSDLADDAFVGLPVEVSQFDENAATYGAGADSGAGKASLCISWPSWVSMTSKMSLWPARGTSWKQTLAG